MATVSETRPSYLSSTVGEGDCLALLSRLQRDLEFRSERAAPRASAGSPQLDGSTRRNRGEANGSKSWSRSCALCAIEISALRKNCIQCLSCGRWFCKACSSWDALKQEYVCRSCAPSSNVADFKGNDGNVRHIGEQDCTMSFSSAKLELDSVPAVDVPLLRTTEWVSLSDHLPPPSNSLTRILVNGNVTDDASADDFGTSTSTFEDLKDREIKKFIVQMHSVLADLERNVCDCTAPSEQHEHIVEAYQRKVATIISNLEEALHFAVDSQAVNDSRSFVSHDEVGGLVRQAAEPYVGRATLMPEEESHTMTARSINFLKTADFLGKLVVSRAMEEIITRHDGQEETTSKADQCDSAAAADCGQPQHDLDAADLLDERNTHHKSSDTFPSFPAYFRSNENCELDPDLLSTGYAAASNGSSEGTTNDSLEDSNWTFLSRDAFARMAFTEASEGELFLPRQQQQQQQAAVFVPKVRKCSSDTALSAASFESDFDDDVIIPDFQDESCVIVEEAEVAGVGPTVSAAAVKAAAATASAPLLPSRPVAPHSEVKPMVAAQPPVQLPQQQPLPISFPNSASVDLMNQQAPVFLKCLEDVEASEGSTVTLRCKVKANPQQLSVQWYKDGHLICDGDSKYSLGRLGNRDYTLSFKDGVTMFDDAEYMVVASNAAGEAKSVAQLIVEPVPAPAVQQAPAAQKMLPQPTTSAPAAQQQKETTEPRVRAGSMATTLREAALPAAVSKATELSPTAKQASSSIAEHKAVVEQDSRVKKPFTTRQLSCHSDDSATSSEQPLASRHECPATVAADDVSHISEEVEPGPRAPVKSLRALRRTSASAGMQKADARIETPAVATDGKGRSQRSAAQVAADVDRSASDDAKPYANGTNKRSADSANVKTVADIPDAPSAQQRTGAGSVAASSAVAIVQDSGCVIDVRSGISRQLLLEASPNQYSRQQQPAIVENLPTDGSVGRIVGREDEEATREISAATTLANREQTPAVTTIAAASVAATKRVVKKIIVVRRTAAS